MEFCTGTIVVSLSYRLRTTTKGQVRFIYSIRKQMRAVLCPYRDIARSALAWQDYRDLALPNCAKSRAKYTLTFILQQLQLSHLNGLSFWLHEFAPQFTSTLGAILSIQCDIEKRSGVTRPGQARALPGHQAILPYHQH